LALSRAPQSNFVNLTLYNQTSLSRAPQESQGKTFSDVRGFKILAVKCFRNKWLGPSNGSTYPWYLRYISLFKIPQDQELKIE
jgi:hypothetical protein